MKHEQWRFDLLKAARLIRENGLQKYHLEGPDGYCILGAITAVLSTSDDYKAATKAAIKQVKMCFGNRSHWSTSILALWNDRPERTAQEVIDLLERAAGDAK
jgi:hypothetical protein